MLPNRLLRAACGFLASSFALALGAQAQVVSLPGNNILLAGWDFDNLPNNTASSATIGTVDARYSDLTGDVSASQNPAAAMGRAYFNGSFGSSTWQGGNNGARGLSGQDTTQNNVIQSRPSGTKIGDITGTGYVGEMALGVNPNGNPANPDRISFVVKATQARGLSVTFAARTNTTGPTFTVNWYAMAGTSGTPALVGTTAIATGTTYSTYTQDFASRKELDGAAEVVLIAEIVQTSGSNAQLFLNNLQIIGAEVSAGAEPPSINTQPLSRTLVWSAGTPISTTFSVAAVSNSGGTLSYQWRRNGQPLSNGNGQSGPTGATSTVSGADTASLTLSNLQPGDAGDYSVVVSASTAPGSTTSNPATLSVQYAPLFSQQPPASVLVNLGQPVTFTAAVGGVPTPALFWQRLVGDKWADLTDAPPALSGTSTGTLSFSAVQASDAGRYRLVARSTLVSGATEVVSSETELQVRLAPVFTTTALPNAVIGQPYLATVSATQTPTSFGATGLPAGLSGPDASGRITGTPTASGSFTVSLSATNEVGSGTAETSLFVLGYPEFTSAPSARGVVGSAFSYTATTAQPATVSVAQLPAGLSFNPATGVLDGIPVEAGDSTVEITATNAAGTRVLLLALGFDSAPALTGPSTTTASIGTSFSLQVGALYAPTTFTANGLPPGLSISNAGVISGVPTALGNYIVSVTASNAFGTSAPLIFTFKVNPAGLPVFTSAASVAGVVGQPLSFQVTASNLPESFSSTGLPAGLSFSASGLLSGTPVPAGVFDLLITATNSLGSAQQTLRVSILGVPVIGSATTASAIAGQPFSYRITASQQPTSFGASPVPAGLSFDSSTGTLSGTPSTGGVFNVTLAATNAAGTGNATLVLTVLSRPAMAETLSATGVNGSAFSYQIPATGSVASYSATGLPAGLTLDTTSGLISGIPTVAGVFPVSLGATNAAGTAQAVLTVTLAGVPALAPYADRSAFRGVALEIPAVLASSDPWLAPQGFSATELPAGLGINAVTGLISGTPSAAGVFSIRVRATNAAGASERTFTLSVEGAPSITSATTLQAGTNQPFSYTIAASGTAIQFGASGLPEGLSFDPATGIVSGSFAQNGEFTFTVTATNPAGSDERQVTVSVAGAPAISAPALITGRVGLPFVYQIVANGSPSGYSAAPLPAGFSVNATTGLITGTPGAASRTTVTLGATNGAGTGTATLVLDFGVPPSVNSAATAEAVQGSAFSYQITTSAGATSTSATGLPAGLSFDPVTRRITGSPSTSGVVDIQLLAGNTYGNGERTLRLTIYARADAITRIYERILGRAPLAPELATTVTSEKLVLELLAGAEYANRGFTRLFELNQALLGQSPSLSQLAARARTYAALGAEQTARDIIASAEFSVRFGDIGAVPFISNTYRNTNNAFISTAQLFDLEGKLLANRTNRARIATDMVAEASGSFLSGRTRALEVYRLLLDREAPESTRSVDEALVASLLPELLRGSVVVRSLALKAMQPVGWLTGSWIGDVNVDQLATERGWVYHSQHGWMFAAPAGGGLWLHDAKLGWLYSSPASYPQVYRHSDRTWYYFHGVRAGGRDFYNHRTGRWERF